MSSKIVSIQEVIEAIEKNGLPIARTWFEYDGYGKITNACVLGQAAINLGVDNYDLMNAITDVTSNSSVVDRIMSYNDRKGKNGYYRRYSTVAKYARKRLEKYSHLLFKVETAKYEIKKGEVV